MNSKSSGKGLEGFLMGKGFYIVLFLCAAVIGLSAWMMTAGNETMEERDGNPGARVETVLVTPDVQAPKIEVMAVPEPTPAPVIEEIEEPAAAVWAEDGRNRLGGRRDSVGHERNGLAGGGRA